MKTRISITDADIENGIPCNSYRCAMARVLQRALNDNGLRVFGKYCRTGMGKRIDLPLEAANWVDCFDDSKHVQAISFDLDLTQP